jgi:aminopeptidase C
MPGTNYGTDLPVHAEVDAVAKAYVDAIVKNPNGTLSTAWKKGFQGIMDAYFGAYPEEFTVNGKKYTPISYRDSFKLDADNYVSLTSFTHHPFYEPFAVEVTDNWRADQAYNVPIDELMEAIYYALENGYTTTWGGDVSETGFTRTGTALLLDPKASTSGSDMERWVGKAEDKPAETAPKEIVPDQAFRQKGFDEKTTTDDHGMHAFGIAKDQFGNKYLMIKNSWGESGKYKGIWYMSDAFCRGKVLDITLHKDALPKELRKKLGI